MKPKIELNKEEEILCIEQLRKEYQEAEKEAWHASNICPAVELLYRSKMEGIRARLAYLQAKVV